jgi:dTDP-4-amino-4,6-dideoxygalactose transaminase
MAPYADAAQTLPVTDALAAENLALPISPVLGADQAREVVAALARAA